MSCFFFNDTATTEIYTLSLTTLFRSPQREGLVVAPADGRISMITRALPPAERSEEHTSELQSLRHLVCRLLLEKKKRREKQIERGARRQFHDLSLNDRHSLGHLSDWI